MKFRPSRNSFFLLAVLAALFACRLDDPKQEETFTFTGLDDSLARYDSALILLETPEGVTDTLFHGKVTPQTSLAGLPAKDFSGGKVLISIEGYKDGRKIYLVEKVYDGNRGVVDSTRPVMLPNASIRIDTANVKMQLGDSIPLPRLVISPADLKDKSHEWSSEPKGILNVTSEGMKAMGAGRALLAVRLVSDTSKWDTLTVVIGVPAPSRKKLDSLRVTPETLAVALHGPAKHFKTEVFPDTASPAVRFEIRDTLVATISADGWVKATGEGMARVFVQSVAEPSVSDTAWVKVNPPVAVTLVRFPYDSLELREGGAPDSVRVEVLPESANAAVTFLLLDSGVATFKGGVVKGVKVGRTSLIARSVEDTSKADTLKLIVLSGVPEKPVVSGSSLPVNTSTPTWTWHGGGGGNGHFRYRLDSEDMSAAIETTDTTFTPLTKLTEDIHTLVVQERNDLNKWSPSGRFTLRIDTTRPNAPKVSLNVNALTNNPRPTWSWSGGMGDKSRFYRYKLDDADLRSGAKDTIGTSFTPSVNLSDTIHTLFVQERDSAGNWSEAGSAALRIDTKKPGRPVVSVSPGALTNDETPTWTWISGGGGGAGYRFKLNDPDLDSGATETSTATFTPTTGLGEGSFTLYVQEKDSAGNWSLAASKNVRIDLTPPSQPRMDSTPYSPLNSLRPKWTWRSGGTGARIFRCKIDTSNLSGAPEQTDSSFSPGSDLSEGKHTLHVQERDSAGNWSAISLKEIVVAISGYVGEPGFAGGRSYSLSLAFNSLGQAYAATYSSGSTYIRKLNGAHWDPVSNVPEPEGSIGNSGLAVSKAGELNAALLKGGIATLWKLVGSNWNSVGPTPESSLVDPSLCFHQNGEPYVAQTDRYGYPIVFRHNGLSWQQVYDPLFFTDRTTKIVLRLSPVGDPYIAYSDSSGSGPVTIARFKAGKWSVIGTIGNSSGPGWAFDFAIGPDNSPYLAYSDPWNGKKATVVRFFNNNWDPIGVAGFTPNPVNDVSMDLDGNGVPFVGFRDESVEGKLSIETVREHKWVSVGGYGISPGTIESFTLKVDKEGVPYVGFRDNPSVAGSVMKASFEP